MVTADYVGAILDRLDGVRVISDCKWKCLCPAHADRSPSLDIQLQDNGKVTAKCWAGCSFKQITEAIKLPMAARFPPNGDHSHNNGKGKASKVYATADDAITAISRGIGSSHPGAIFVKRWAYKDAAGEVVAYTARWNLPNGNKTFRPVALFPEGWRIKDPVGLWPLFRLTELTGTNPVYVLEGEGKTELAAKLGLNAVTSAHGAQSPSKTDWTPLAGKDVVILPDAGGAGESYGLTVASILSTLTPPALVKIVYLPDLANGEDLVEFVERRRKDGKDDDAIVAEIASLVTNTSIAAPASVPAPANNHTPVFPEPVLCSELSAGDTNSAWLLHGYIMDRSTTMLAALWKSGKTTWLAYLLRAFGDGRQLFCGRVVLPSNVLIVTEEPASRWVRRRDDLSLGDNLRFIVRPFRAKPTLAQWHTFVVYIADLVKMHEIHLVVFDTLAALWPVQDENDAAQVQSALTPLHAITELAALLIIHHIRKSDGGEATASRGSGALPAFVDTIVELRRHDANNKTSTKRVLTSYGRWDETPAEVVIELDAENRDYRDCGDRQTDKLRTIKDTIIKFLPTQRPGMTYADLQDDANWPDRPPTKSTIVDAMEEGVRDELWIKEGSGKKGSPFVFWRQTT